MFFVVAGLLVLGVTSFMFSDAGRKFYEPEPQAIEANCQNYQVYYCGSGTTLPCSQNKQCASTGTRLCRRSSLNGADPNYKLCAKPFGECGVEIIDCCPIGYSVSTDGKSCTSPTPTPTATQSQTPTPSTCANKCVPAANCIERAIGPCPSAGDVYCCKIASPTPTNTTTTTPTPTTPTGTNPPPTSTPTSTPKPTGIFCTDFKKDYPNRTCNNQICSGTPETCARRLLTNAKQKYCIHRTSVERVYSCCRAGDIIVGDACVSATPTPTVTASQTPTMTASGTPTGTPTLTGTPTPSITPSITPSCTRPPLPSGCHYNSDDCTDTTYSCDVPTTSNTPSVTHTPSETGFADEPLLYIGVILYGIGVLSFVAARYYGVARRKSL